MYSSTHNLYINAVISWYLTQIPREHTLNVHILSMSREFNLILNSLEIFVFETPFVQCVGGNSFEN